MIRTPLRPLARILRAREAGQNPDEIEAENIARREAEMQIRAHRTGEQRLAITASVFVIAFAAVAIKMGMLASAAPAEPRVEGTRQAIYSQRADITDRHGRILATNMQTHALYAHPDQMVDPARAANELARIFPDLRADELLRQFTVPGRRFTWVKPRLSPEQMQAVHDIGEPGLLFGPREMRLYPNGSVASHILGGATFGHQGVHSAEVVGVAGVELFFDERLRDPAADGSVRLSIDLTAQAAMEEVLSNGMRVMNARGAAGVLMDVHTGEVLAMASLPDFDPNDRPRRATGNDPSSSPLFNRALQGQYELGSTFKIFPVAQALDLGLINPNTHINTTTPMRIGSHTVGDYANYGPSLSVTDIIARSSNVGTVRIAQMVGVERQQAFLRSLGFFEPTALEMSEAATGRPIVPQRWPAITAATVSFGHGLAASPLHLAAAYSTIANGGTRVTPTLMAGAAPDRGERVMSDAASGHAVRMLRQVVTRGTARSAEVAGYEVAGKTGTADKPRPGGGYYQNRVVANFAAAFPASDPQYVLIVTLDEPSVNRGGGESRTAGATAVPVAAELVRRLSPILGLRPVDQDALPDIAAPADLALLLARND
ncbi:MAG: penicillin-binding protein 2 [Paracoccus sp. (in: a-proteobacteria)]|nr:penicillin-binding protein 2 [Paracoccus sp. (in: a-proteobacteria)]